MSVHRGGGGGWWWSGPGGSSNFFGGVPPNFFGGVLQIFGGGFLQIFWGGSPNFQGGSPNFVFLFFFSISFPQKKFFWDAPLPQDGQCTAGTHPTGMHSCQINLISGKYHITVVNVSKVKIISAITLYSINCARILPGNYILEMFHILPKNWRIM